MPDHTIRLTGAKILTESGIIDHHTLFIAEQKIAAIWPASAQIATNSRVITLPSHYHIIPGIIDLFVHGACGSDVMDGTPKALTTIATTLPQEGVTAFLAATMTQSYPRIEQAVSNVRDFVNNNNKCHSQLLGIYLEGPFFCKQYSGAQDASQLALPDINAIKRWQRISGNLIKIVALAPELEGAFPLIDYLSHHGVIVSVGHSGASYEQTNMAIASGCRHGTHLFNAMSGLEHRRPGVAYALLLDDKVYVELIADGIHLSAAALKLVLKTKPKDKILLISDAMRAKYLDDGCYELGGQQVIVKDQKARLSNGKLAGSTLKMNEAIKNMIRLSGCRLEDAVEFACVNPAKELAIFNRKGSIAVGKDADIVVIDQNYQVVLTLCRGNISYQRQLL